MIARPHFPLCGVEEKPYEEFLTLKFPDTTQKEKMAEAAQSS